MSDQKSNVLGETMRRARIAQGYEVWEIAKMLHTGVDTVYDWEAGTDKPDGEIVEMFATLVQRPLSIFYLPEPPMLEPRAEALSQAMAEAAPAMQEAADAVVGKLGEVLALHERPDSPSAQELEGMVEVLAARLVWVEKGHGNNRKQDEANYKEWALEKAQEASDEASTD